MNEQLKIIISAQTADAIKNINNAKSAVGDLGTEGESSGGKFSAAMGKIADVTKAAMKVTATAIASVASGVVALTGAAIKNYAEYEQLVGGVETLFKESASVVQGYAAEAYKTAGLSANAYMETVTGFSASLLQSLGNDTAAAAEYGNMAIIDMSDNANKMGTSMESIQNAYQGFAKQNYTMLDNLKLGYGGTKEEMQRLIDDANRVKEANGEMADLSIDSFADVVEAIHTVQTEMGITGTTAKEASATISGSVAMTKAAWSNLVTGLADDNADMTKLINDFVNSVKTAAKNILPRVEMALNGVADLISELLPIAMELIPPIIMDILPKILEAATNIVVSLVNGIVEAFPTLVETLTTLLPQIITTIMELIPLITGALLESLPTLLETVIQIIAAIVVGLSETLPTILTQIVEFLPLIIQTLIDNIPILLDAAIQLFTAIVDAVPKIVPPLIAALPQIIDSLINTLLENLPIVLDACITLLNAIVDAIPEIIPVLVEALPEIINSIINALIDATPIVLEAAFTLFYSLVTAIPQILPDLISGIGEIIRSVKENLQNKLSEVFENIKTAIKDKIESAKESVLNTFTTLKTNVTTKIDELKNNVKTKFDEIKSKITKPVEDARDAVKGIVDKIKGFFNFTWSLPALKVPKFSISPSGWKVGDLLKGSIPKLSVVWNAKGGVFDKPTLFNYAGSLQGIGENGAEAVVPLENNLGWLDKLATMLAERVGTTPVILQVDGKTFAQTSISTINQLTKQTGVMQLKIV